MLLLRRSRYAIIAIIATGPLVACGDPGIFDRVAPERSSAATGSDWPNLADTPATPPQGVYTAAAPDPAAGDALQIDLSVAADAAARRGEALSGPVE